MRVVNEKFETITEYDLTAGKLIQTEAVKENAEPIDNVNKFAWSDEDWEDVQMYVPDLPQPEEPESGLNDPEYNLAERVVKLETDSEEMKEALEMILSGVTE